MTLGVIFVVMCLIIVGILTRKPKDERHQYASLNHRQWCDALGVYANGVPKWRYSEKPTAKALADIVDGPESRKLDSLLWSRWDRVEIKGLSGKTYIVSCDRSKTKKKLSIKEKDERPYDNCSSSG